MIDENAVFIRAVDNSPYEQLVVSWYNRKQIMKLQISSGLGPVECELAVAKLADALTKEVEDAVIIQTTPGYHDGCYKSVIIESTVELNFLDGTIKWICQSPFRPHHKRKNWFIDVSPLRLFNEADINEEQIRYDTFKSSGKGGQNVNKVETGVRATYIPLGLSAVSTDERSQHMNKKLALKRLIDLINQQNAEGKRGTDRDNWLEHTRLVRGNELRIYEGMDFKRVK
jgi:peptide chain release factor